MRNFRIDYIGCEENDIIILASDGVHDNLDPFILGLHPSDVGFKETDTWDTIDPLKKNQTATEYSIFMLKNLLFAKKNGIQEKIICKNEAQKCWKLPALHITIGDETDLDTGADLSCSRIVQRLLAHCIATNKNAANFMRDNPNMKLPKDYQNFPGKMDHTTAVAFRVKSQYFQKNKSGTPYFAVAHFSEPFYSNDKNCKLVHQTATSIDDFTLNPLNSDKEEKKLEAKENSESGTESSSKEGKPKLLRSKSVEL